MPCIRGRCAEWQLSVMSRVRGRLHIPWGKDRFALFAMLRFLFDSGNGVIREICLDRFSNGWLKAGNGNDACRQLLSETTSLYCVGADEEGAVESVGGYVSLGVRI